MQLTESIVLCAFGDGLALWWIVLVLRSRFLFSDLVKAADTGLFPVSRLLKPGFLFWNRFPGGSEKLSVLLSGKGEKGRMDGFSLYCAEANAIGLGFPLLACSAFAAAISGELSLFGMGLLLTAVAVYAPFYRFRDREKTRKDEIARDLPAIISKTVLLNDAGLTLREAWGRVAVSADGEAYKEMRKTEERMKNGMPDDEAWAAFAEACHLREARQFAAMLTRQKVKGGDDVSAALRFLNHESWENRKQRAKIRGQAASEAMLLPMLMIFVGILIMVMVPIFSGLSV